MQLVVISGCSGGGKSTLLAELRRRGHNVVDEPGRRIITRELRARGRALPWIDGAAFARRAIEISLQDREEVAGFSGWTFFDRGLIDAAAALEHLTGEPILAALGPAHRYHSRVFLTPPWPEIYVTDDDRRHDLVDAIAEYERLCHAYDSLGYETIILPKVGVANRADLVLELLAASRSWTPSQPGSRTSD